VKKEKPASLRGELTSPDISPTTPVSVPPAGFEKKLAHLVAAVNGGATCAAGRRQPLSFEVFAFGQQKSPRSAEISRPYYGR